MCNYRYLEIHFKIFNSRIYGAACMHCSTDLVIQDRSVEGLFNGYLEMPTTLGSFIYIIS